MSSNRIRPQFSSLSFNFGDPLKIDWDLASSPALGRLDRIVAPGLADHATQAVPNSFSGLDSVLVGHLPVTAPTLSSATRHSHFVSDIGGAVVSPSHDHLSGLNTASGFTVAAGTSTAQHARFTSLVDGTTTPASVWNSAPALAQPVIHHFPTVPAVSGQLWTAFGGVGIGNPDGHSDWRVEHADSDGLSDDWVIQQSQPASGSYAAIGLDTSANLSITLDLSFHLRITNLSTGVDLSNTVVASTADFDVMNAFAVDANSNTIYADLFGYDYIADGGDIIKITYNQTTGAISNPYSWNDTTHAFSINLNNVLLDSTSSGNVYADGRAFFLSHDGSTLYYVDDNDNDPGGFWGFSTNGVFKVSTTGSVGGGNAPTPVLLSSQVQFPTNDSAGYITGIAVSEAKGIIYFTTNGSAEGVNTSQDGIWWMPIAGGTATKMTIPGGVSVSYPVFYGNALAIDIKSQQLYYADKATGQIVQFTLAADGHSFSSAANFAKFDSTGGTVGGDGGFANAMAFDNLPTLSSLTATTTEAVQGGSAITLLTAAPSITDTDNLRLNHMTITVTNAQVGDNLFCNGAQSGTVSGVTISWNSSTHALTLSGDVAFATYQSLMQLISFQDGGTDNSTGSHPTRTINWTVSDGVTIGHPTTADSNEQITTVVIDRAPTLTADNYAVVEAATVTGTSGTGGTGVLGNDNDKDADAIIVTAVNGSGANVGNFVAGTYGHLTLNANGSYSYSADNAAAIAAAATGSHPVDTFTYTVSDGLGGVTSSTVSFTIDRVPTVVVDNPSGEALEGGVAITGNVLTNDSDKDGDTLTVSAVNGLGGNVGISTAGTYGHITIGATGSYSYLADNTAAIDGAATGSHLTDTFSYTANDGHGGTTTTNITVTIDRPPTVVSDNPAGQALESGSAITGNVLTNDSDRDGDTLVVSAVAGLGGNVGNSIATTYGHITINSNGTYSYTANNTVAIDAAATGSHLTDTVNYTASDGLVGTTTTSITVTLDRGPTVVGDSNTAVEGGSAVGSNVLTNDSDRDGDSLVISAVAGSGANVGNSTATTYGHITVNADGSYVYAADNTAAIDAAPGGSHPVDSISITADDGNGGTTAETLNITIDRPPAVTADAPAGEALESGGAITGNVLTNDSDSDGDTLTVSAVAGSGANVGISTAGTYGHIIINSNGSYSYSADNAVAIDAAASGAHLTDIFGYTGDDGHGGTTSSTITVTVDRGPDVVADNGPSQALEGSGFVADNVLTNDSDRDGDTLTVSAVAGSAGNVAVNTATTYGHILIAANGGYSYSADNTLAIDAAATGSHLTDVISYAADDGQGGTATTTLTITLDRGPDTTDDANSTAESGTVSKTAATGVLANDSDRDGDSLIVSAVGGSPSFVGNSFATTYGHITVNADGSYSYTADNTAAIDAAAAGSHPVDSVSITADDGNGGTTTETLNITLDRAPLAQDDDTSTDEATPLSGNVLSNNGHGADADPDGDTLGVAAVNGSAGDVGTQITLASGALLTVNADGTYSYDPNHVFDHLPDAASGGVSTATDSFTYTLTGGSTATVTVTINGVDSDDTIDGTPGNDRFRGGIGNDTINGADGNDTLHGQRGNDVIHGGNGSDVLRGGKGQDQLFGEAGDDILHGGIRKADIADGGAGDDTLHLRGDYSTGVVFGAATLVSIETIRLDAGYSYKLTMDDGNVAAGETLTVRATALAAGETLDFNGTAESDGTFGLIGGVGDDMLRGGHGDDHIIGGDGADRLAGNGGADLLAGGAGADTFVYHAVSDSSSAAYDRIVDFDADQDKIDVWFQVQGVDATQSAAHRSQLASVFDAAHLAAHHAALATIGASTFLIVDANGTAGYQDGQDLLIHVTGMTGTLDTGDFV